MDNRKKIRPWGRTELAQAYFPDLCAASAWRKLRGWITLCEPLCAELAERGRGAKRRTFTPAEVAAIFRYIGEP